MAELKEKFFGKISGAFGDFIGIVRGDDNYIVKKKANRKIDNSPQAVERRNKFGVAIQASKAVNSITNLKLIWKLKAPSKLSAFNNFIKYNYHYVESNGTTTGFSLLPGLGFAFSVDNFAVTEDSISLTIFPLINSFTFDTGVEKNIEAYFLIELNNPISENSKKVLFFIKSSGKQSLDLENSLTFSIALKETDTKLISQYSVTKVHVVFCTLDAEEKPVHYSVTYSN